MRRALSKAVVESPAPGSGHAHGLWPVSICIRLPGPNDVNRSDKSIPTENDQQEGTMRFLRHAIVRASPIGQLPAKSSLRR